MRQGRLVGKKATLRRSDVSATQEKPGFLLLPIPPDSLNNVHESCYDSNTGKIFINRLKHSFMRQFMQAKPRLDEV
jgi:hypothetical protein